MPREGLLLFCNHVLLYEVLKFIFSQQTINDVLMESEKHADNVEKLTEIMNYDIGLYNSAITANPTEAKGVYTVSYVSGRADTGGGGVYYQTSYYDVSTKKFLGAIWGAN